MKESLEPILEGFRYETLKNNAVVIQKFVSIALKELFILIMKVFPDGILTCFVVSAIQMPL